MKDDLDKSNLNYEYDDIVVCERSINFDFIVQVANISVNEEVLLVNDDRETTLSSISDLKGTGKELFASAINQNSIRKYGPYIAINFSALCPDIFKSMHK